MYQVAMITETTQTAPTARAWTWTWHLARVLAIAGALLFAYSMWVPWAIVHLETFDDQLNRYTYSLALGPGDATNTVTAVFGPLGWAIGSTFGLVLCCFLWQRAWPAMQWVSTLAYGQCFFLASIIQPNVPTHGDFIELNSGRVPGSPTDYFGITGIERTLPGYTIFRLSLVIIIVASLLLIVCRWHLRDSFRAELAVARQRRRRYPTPCVALVALGLALWGTAVFALPWLPGQTFGEGWRRVLEGNALQLAPTLGQYTIGVLLSYPAVLLLVAMLLRAPVSFVAILGALWLGGTIATLVLGTPGGFATSSLGFIAFVAGLLLAAIGVVLGCQASAPAPAANPAPM